MVDQISDLAFRFERAAGAANLALVLSDRLCAFGQYLSLYFDQPHRALTAFANRGATVNYLIGRNCFVVVKKG